MENYEYVELKPYKGFSITKGWRVDERGKKISGTEVYDVFEGEDAVGESFKTLRAAQQYINTLANS